MTTTAPVATQTPVDCVQLADGKLVRLAGRIGPDEVSALRRALLTPLVRRCRDLVVDAGQVESMTDDAVAVLLAATEWVAVDGGRFLLSCASPELEATLRELGIEGLLPRLR